MKTSIPSFNREIQVDKKPELEPEPEEKINWWSIGAKVLSGDFGDVKKYFKSLLPGEYTLVATSKG